MSGNFTKVTGNQFGNEEWYTGFTDDYTRSTEEALLSYYLNLECLKQIPNSELRMGKAWQRLYWFYSDKGNEKWKTYAAEQAVKNFNIFLKKQGDTMKTEEYMTLNLIAGEMSCAIGKNAEAMEYFKINTAIPKYTAHELARVSARRYKEIRNEG
jgi:hypothetical protein